MIPEQLVELRRARWRRVRSALLLSDPMSEDFATSGLARHVEDPRVRFLVLPADPDRSVLAFNSEFWEWWKTERDNPFPAQRTRWGYDHHPTGEAAVVHDHVGNDRWAWDTYLALHRSGSLEFCLGRSATYEWRDRTVFRWISRENAASRERNRASVGSSHISSMWLVQPITKAMSTGPVPTVWYAM